MDEHAVDVASAGGVLRFDVDRHRVLAPSRGSPPRFADSLMRPQDSNSSSSSMNQIPDRRRGRGFATGIHLNEALEWSKRPGPPHKPLRHRHFPDHSTPWIRLATARSAACERHQRCGRPHVLAPQLRSSQSAKNLPPPGPHRRRTAPPAPPRVRRHPPSLACPSAARPRRARRRDRCIAARMQRGLATGDQCYLASNMLATSSEQPRRQTESVCCPLPKTPCST